MVLRRTDGFFQEAPQLNQRLSLHGLYANLYIVFSPCNVSNPPNSVAFLLQFLTSAFKMSANPRHVTRKERLICETRPVQSSFRYGRVDPSNPDPCAGASVRVVFRGQYPPEFALALRVPFLSVVAHSPVVASASNNQYFNMKSNQKTNCLSSYNNFCNTVDTILGASDL